MTYKDAHPTDHSSGDQSAPMALLQTSEEFVSDGTNSEPRPMDTYIRAEHAFDFFNAALFDGKLPVCLITLQRQRGVYGYFSGDRFARVGNPADVKDEIALNPAHFDKQTPTEVFSTLAHEMAHLWQHHFGKSGRGRYHNKQWARKMNELGLPPSNTGKPGGKETGDRVSNYIREDGPFDRACRAYLERYPTLLYQDRAYTGKVDEAKAVRERLSKLASKTTYDCPRCQDQRAWAKPRAKLMCGICDEGLLPVRGKFEAASVDSDD